MRRRKSRGAGKNAARKMMRMRGMRRRQKRMWRVGMRRKEKMRRKPTGSCFFILMIEF